MKKNNIFLAFVTITILALFLFACSNKSLLDKPLRADEIDKIQIALSMGNPAYGAESKIITDKNEIKELVTTINNATIMNKVNEDNRGIGFPTHYYFYNGETLIQHIIFNEIHTEIVLKDQYYYYVKYTGKTPYELYESSKAEIIIVDLELNVMDKVPDFGKI